MNNWTRAQLKDRAKNVLRVNYWIAFVVALIMIFVAGSGSISGGFTYRTSFDTSQYNEMVTGYNNGIIEHDYKTLDEFYDQLRSPRVRLLAGVMGTIILFASLFAIAIRVFLFNPLTVGCYKFFSSSAETPHSNMSPVGLGFKKGNYWGIVKAMFLRGLYTLLWFLLLMIPGIIKFYAYRMVPYIIADNPQMDASEAITLSRKMMDGAKWKAFVLDLSFIGWYLLGALACGIGGLFVNPYKHSTDAQLYLVLRDKAINNNYCTPEMLNLTANA